MSYDVLWQSTLSNIVLVFAFLAYKGLSRIVGSKCHYTSEHGLEIHLPDPEEVPDLGAINQIMAERGLSMRLRRQST